MQSPQLLYALARQDDRIAQTRTSIDRVIAQETPATRPAQISEPRLAWFWQLLFRRRETVAS